MICELQVQMDGQALEIDHLRQQLQRGEVRFGEIEQAGANNLVNICQLQLT